MLKKLIDHIRHRRFCRLNNYFCPDCIYHDFIYEGAIFRGNKCRWGRKEEKMPVINTKDLPEFKTVRLADLTEDSINLIAEAVIDKLNKSANSGHWVRNDNGTYSCSKCWSWIPNEQRHYARYCLYCGAKMSEEEDE